MPNLAVFSGEALSSFHINQVQYFTGINEIKSLKMYGGSKTADESTFGNGVGTLYVAGHGDPSTVGGLDETMLANKLIASGLDSSKFDTIFLLSCVSAANFASVTIRHSQARPVIQKFYDLCQMPDMKALSGLTVKGFRGWFGWKKEHLAEKKTLSPAKFTGNYVLLPNGNEVPASQAIITLSPTQGSYVPPNVKLKDKDNFFVPPGN